MAVRNKGTHEIEPDDYTGKRRRSEQLERRVLKVCDSAGAFIEWWGFKAVHGRVWTLLALHRSAMAQSELAQKLGVSRSLISSAISELVDFGLVRAINNHRNSPYEATADVWPTITDILRSREWMLLESARVALEAAMEEAQLSQALGETPNYDIDKMRMLLRMTETAQTFLKMIVGMRVPKSMENLGTWVGKASALVQSFRTHI